jgi:hypothetical protein
VAYGYGTMQDMATTCFTCDGWDQPECNIEQLPGWFAADSLAVNANGDAIYFTATDNDQTPPKSITVDFKKGLPPVAFTAQR